MSHKNITENKKVHNLIIKGQIHSEDITINSYAPNNSIKIYKAKMNKIMNRNWFHNLRIDFNVPYNLIHKKAKKLGNSIKDLNSIITNLI